ncbi:MAG: nitroreductase family protein [Clostridia bacterium]|nr:nitroreductase family protein [Clostridia bacterium]
MKNTLDAIRDRRSCRAYLPNMITNDELSKILDAAFLSPSAKNMQRRHLTVITNQAYLDELNIKICAKIDCDPHEYHVFYHAPVVVALSSLKGDRWCREDMGIMIENICLAAESMDIGSVILGLPQRYFETKEATEDIKKMGAPEDYEPILFVSLGYKAQKDIPAKPRDTKRISYIK